jgi:hypothetical protein
MIRRFPLALACCSGVLLALTSCASTTALLPQAAPLPTLANEISFQPPRAKAGECWAQDTSPAIIETVTEQIQIRPEQRDPISGVLLQPASYRTETRQSIVTQRRDFWFRAPCPDELTADLIASLQRALRARGVYRGQITGTFDSPTRRAVQLWQSARGLDSSSLSLRGGRELGLISWENAPS